MNIRINIWLLTALTFISCSEEKIFEIELPISSYNSKEPYSKGGLNEIYLTQISKSQLVICSNNSIGEDTVSIESDFFKRLYLNHVDSEFLFQSELFLALDKSLSIKMLEHLKLQIRKATISNVTLLTKNGEFNFKLPPYGLDTIGKGDILYPPKPPEFNLKNELGKTSILECKIFRDSISAVKLPSMTSVNMTEYCLEQQEVSIIYDFDKSCNYQSFVSFFDLVFSTRKTARKRFQEMDSLCTEKQLRRLFPIRLISKTLTNSGQKENANDSVNLKGNATNKASIETRS